MSTDLKTEPKTESLPAVPETARDELALARTSQNRDTGPLAYILDTDLFNHLWRVATGYSRSSMVPDIFKGKPDDCFVGLQLALRLEVDPFMLFQSMYVVHGKPGLEAKLAIALCNARGPFSDRIQWRFKGQGMDRECTAFAHDRNTGNVCEATVSMKIAKAEGWIDKNGSKWKTIPDLMLQYRSAAWLIRTNCPEVLMGMATRDELIDTTEADVVVSETRTLERPPSKAALVAERLKGNGQTPAPAPEPTFNPPTETEQRRIEGQEAYARNQSQHSEESQERQPGDEPAQDQADDDDGQDAQQKRVEAIRAAANVNEVNALMKAVDSEVEAGLCSKDEQLALVNVSLKRKSELGRKGGRP